MKPDLNQFEAFIFDLDGTLINSEKYHVEAFAAAVRSQSDYEITEEEGREFFDIHTLAYVPILNERHGLKIDAEAALEFKREHVEKNFKTEVFSYAVGFYHSWSKRKRIAMASNSPKLFVKNALVSARMIDWFEVVCTADDVAKRKPDPEMYLLTASLMNLKPEQILVFEDSRAGVEAAKAAGCSVVLMDNGSDRTYDDIEMFLWKDLK